MTKSDQFMDVTEKASGTKDGWEKNPDYNPDWCKRRQNRYQKLKRR